MGYSSWAGLRLWAQLVLETNRSLELWCLNWSLSFCILQQFWDPNRTFVMLWLNCYGSTRFARNSALLVCFGCVKRVISVFFNVLRWVWVFFEQTGILSGIQFTRHIIEFVLVETKWFVGSNVNQILTRQTCGRRSSSAAGSKRRLLAFYICRTNLLYVLHVQNIEKSQI